jgi:hypothetical protein
MWAILEVTGQTKEKPASPGLSLHSQRESTNPLTNLPLPKHGRVPLTAGRKGPNLSINSQN